jgi:hypothetical protein
MAPTEVPMGPPTKEQIIFFIFNYYPSQAAAATFVALFLFATIWNSVITYRTGRSLFMTWVTTTGLLEVSGRLQERSKS